MQDLILYEMIYAYTCDTNYVMMHDSSNTMHAPSIFGVLVYSIDQY